jgi:hypothetical protein
MSSVAECECASCLLLPAPWPFVGGRKCAPSRRLGSLAAFAKLLSSADRVSAAGPALR